jgi:hypothetical protein
MSFGSVDRFIEEASREQQEERTKRDIEKNNRKLAMEIQDSKVNALDKFRVNIENEAFRAGYMAGMKDGLDVAKDRL